MEARAISGLELALRLGGGVVLTAANAFFVATEFALTRIRQLDASEFREGRRLRLAWRMTEELEIYLTSCQAGITLSSILLGVVAEPAVSHLIRPLGSMVGIGPGALPWISVVVAVAIINLVHAVWGEQTPTYAGVERPKQIARWTAPIHYAWTKAIRPVITVGDWLAKGTLGLLGIEMKRSWTEAGAEAEGEEVPDRATLKRRMGEVLARGDLSRERRREVLNALAIEDLPVREIMVPRDAIAAFRTGRSLDQNLAVLAEHNHTRLPLCGDEGLDDVRGVIYVPALAARIGELRAGEVSLADLAVPAMPVPAGTRVSDLIDRFQDARQELALVQDDGRVVGLVTTTDAFEAIIGDLRDPFD